MLFPTTHHAAALDGFADLVRTSPDLKLTIRTEDRIIAQHVPSGDLPGLYEAAGFPTEAQAREFGAFFGGVVYDAYPLGLDVWGVTYDPIPAKSEGGAA